MKTAMRAFTILVAEDDADDREMTRDAFEATRRTGDLRFVNDGEELMSYLRHLATYAAEGTAPRPTIILMDLNMPKLNGHEALAEIKADPLLRRIPIVVLTSSHSSTDVTRAYDAGASGFVSKPHSRKLLVDALRVLGDYWAEAVELPEAET